MKYYHATTESGYYGILESESINTSQSGVIYLCMSPDDAIKFLAVRGHKLIYCFELNVDEKDVQESFDHSQTFFKCRAFYINENISISDITNITKYEQKS